MVVISASSSIPFYCMLGRTSHLGYNKFRFLLVVCRPYWGRWSSRGSSGRSSVKVRCEDAVTQEKDAKSLLERSLQRSCIKDFNYDEWHKIQHSKNKRRCGQVAEPPYAPAAHYSPQTLYFSTSGTQLLESEYTPGPSAAKRIR
jgi:hypothetical protein